MVPFGQLVECLCDLSESTCPICVLGLGLSATDVTVRDEELEVTPIKRSFKTNRMDFKREYR